MSDTIRKVQIEVDVVNGDLKINSPDVTSIRNALKQVKDEADATWRAVHGSPSSTGTGSLTRNFGGGAKSVVSSDSIKHAADEIREWYSSQQQLAATPIKIGRLGYANHVRERSASIAQDELDFAKRAGLADGFDEHAIHKLRGHLERRAASSIREVDRESANSTADSVRSEEKRGAALDKSRNAALGAAKGLLQLAASADTNAVSLVQSVVAIEGLANVAKLAHTAMGPLGIGLTAVAAGILVIKTAYQEAYETSQMYWKSIAKDSELANERITRSALLKHEQGTRLALGVPMTGQADRFLQTFNLSAEREAEVRKVEAGNFTPQHKAAFRARAAASVNFDERQRTDAAELEFKKKQLAGMEKAETELKQKAIEAEQLGRRAVKDAETVRDHVMDESTAGIAVRATAQAATGQIPDGPGMLGWARWIGRKATGSNAMGQLAIAVGDNVNLGLDRKTGQWNSKLNAKDKANEHVLGVAASAAQNNADIHRRLEVAGQEKQKLKDDIANKQMQLLTTTKDQRDAAYSAFSNERQRVTGLNQSFGSASVGERRIAMRLQEKHLRIEKQRASNRAAGRAEDEGVEQYSHWEMQQNTFGGIADKTIRLQREATAKKEGHLVETDLDTLEAKHKEEEAKPLQPLIDNVKAAGIDVEKGAKELADAIKAAFPFETLISNVKAELDQMKALNESKAMLRSKWF